jgi:hypothetical protein
MSRGRDEEELEPPGLETQMLALEGGYSMRKEEVVLDL